MLLLPELTTVLGSCPGTSSLIISLLYVRRTDAVAPWLLLNLIKLMLTIIMIIMMIILPQE